jgi:hypothetical protein
MPRAADPPAEDGPPPHRRKLSRIRRLVPIALLIVALAPGLWWRSPARWHPIPLGGDVRFVPLVAHTPATWPADLRLVGAWQLKSSSAGFGGYSALLVSEGDTLTAISDTAGMVQMRRPDRPSGPAARFGVVGRALDNQWGRDVEAATSDPRTGVRWFAYEEINLVRRIAPGESAGAWVRPPAIRDWPDNGGAESMVRLADGRFIFLAEDVPWLSQGARAGLLFPSDPITGARPISFSFKPPLGYEPTDMAALPDGRTIIVLRTLDLPYLPYFKTMLVVADPADIVAGREWRWRKLANIDGSAPRENYEGLAIAPDAHGATLWLISDDNLSRLQRTLLLELHLDLPPRGAAGK